MFKNCKQCNKEFQKDRRTSMKYWLNVTAYCSRECMNNWRRGNPEYKEKLNLVGLSLGRQKGQNTGRIPWNKGKQILEATRRKIIEARKLQKNAIVFQSGENHPNWRGGVTDLTHKIGNMPEYKAWRLSVYERDEFTCQTCYSVGGKLNADHIVPFAAILLLYGIKDVEEARNCNDLWDTKNGRTLCRSCHTKTDTYGVNGKYAVENLRNSIVN